MGKYYFSLKFIMNPEKISHITGVILAGGQSKRFGSNKAFATFHGTPLIEKVLQTMQSVFEHCLIVTNTPKEFQGWEVPVAKDVIPHRGPLGGILTGLLHAQNEAIFITPCDTPLLHPEVIRFVVEKGREFDAAILVQGGVREYLLGLYSHRVRPVILRQLSEERLSMREFCQRIENRIWIQLEGDYAFNVNTQRDLEILQQHYAD